MRKHISFQIKLIPYIILGFIGYIAFYESNIDFYDLDVLC